MKKLFLRLGIALVILIVVVALAVSLFLDGAVKRGVESVGSSLTQVNVKLESVNLSLLSGSGKIKGLLVGNPPGFPTPHAISVGSASVALKPGSLLSDKIVITSINVESPEIIFDGGLGGNNLGKILSNVEANTGGKATNAPAQKEGAGKKLEVDDFVIKGAKLTAHVNGLGGQPYSVSLGDIHLTGLGTGPDGITSAELTRRILTEIYQAALKSAEGGMGNLGKNAAGMTKGLLNSSNAPGEALKDIGHLFQNKK